MWILNILIMTIFCNSVIAGDYRVVDLTHQIDKDSIYWPGNPDYNFTILFRGLSGNGYWYESNAFETAEHMGTHVDSPSHFAESKHRIQQIPMENLVGPGVIINIKEKVLTDPDYRVIIDDLTAWETLHGRIPDRAVVVINSGWTYKYPNKTQTFGSQSVKDPSTFHFPSWHEKAVDWLVKYRNINAIGVDTPSLDYGQSTSFPVHVILGKANIPGVENVANLDLIPESGSMIYVAPINLYDGSGAPARVFATISNDKTNAAISSTFSVLIILGCHVFIYFVTQAV